MHKTAANILIVAAAVLTGWGLAISKPLDLHGTAESVNDTQPSITELQDVLGWLKFYQYASEDDIIKLGSCWDCEVELCEESCLLNLTVTLTQPLIEFKQFYSIKPEDGNLTQEVTERMKQHRCKEKDIKEVRTDTETTKDGAHSRVKRFTKLSGTKWDLRSDPIVTISFRNYLSQFPEQQQRLIAEECATLWAEPSGLEFEIRPFGGATNIGINYEYIDGPYNSLGSGQSPTPFSNGYSFLKLDRAERWKLRNSSPGQGVSLKWAMCHEMGHNLDLGHSNDPNSIMYPSAGSRTERLSSDDKQGMVSMYGRANGRTVARSQVPSPRPSPKAVPKRRIPPTPKPNPTQAPKPAKRKISKEKRKKMRKAKRKQNKKQKRKSKPQFRRALVEMPDIFKENQFKVPSTSDDKPPPGGAQLPTTTKHPPPAVNHVPPPDQRRVAPPGHVPNLKPERGHVPNFKPDGGG